VPIPVWTYVWRIPNDSFRQSNYYLIHYGLLRIVFLCWEYFLVLKLLIRDFILYKYKYTYNVLKDFRYLNTFGGYWLVMLSWTPHIIFKNLSLNTTKIYYLNMSEYKKYCSSWCGVYNHLSHLKWRRTSPVLKVLILDGNYAL